MQLDVRLPMGVMFTVMGVILIVYGLITWTNSDMYAKSLGYNINFWWGICLAVFGGGMLWLARRGAQTDKQSVADREAK
jgi:hypothetical protein